MLDQAQVGTTTIAQGVGGMGNGGLVSPSNEVWYAVHSAASPTGWDLQLELFQTRGISPSGFKDTLKVIHYKSGTTTISIPVTLLVTQNYLKTSKWM